MNHSAVEPLPPGLLSNRPENVGPSGPLAVLLLDVANSPFKDQAYARSQMLKYCYRTRTIRPINRNFDADHTITNFAAVHK